ncbi:DUF6119 family protein [Micromonospora sp. WMMD975]|uniref:DUF6119 family protein n=1 Tax=Micromonospora sp. WMMD975 TaxID=3016087 RepID=UPI00249A7658|nr:DUF6119 family protein [Micromonospora sp. WMMD975]WFE31454.1 TIGR04141 family sporadically distributed protein [Micromonospora sp. WMMD975]
MGLTRWPIVKRAVTIPTERRLRASSNLEDAPQGAQDGYLGNSDGGWSVSLTYSLSLGGRVDLVLFKLRDDLDEGDWGLRAVVDEEYKQVPVKEIAGLEIRLYVKTAKVNVPKWQKDLMLLALDQAAEEIIGLKNQSTGALVLIERGGHRFLLVYGTGRHAVDSSSIEAGFGLRVAANVIDPESLKGVDTRAIVGSGRSQVISMPSAGSLHKLGIEPTADLVRYLEGKPPEEIGTGIAGGDSLRLTMKSFSYRSLPEKLDEVVAAYDSREYKDKFPFLDYFTRVPRTIGELHSKLRAKLDAKILSGGEDIEFMNPDSDRMPSPDRVLLKWGRKSYQVQGQISKDAVLKVVSQWDVPDPMTSLQVYAYYEGVENPIKTSLMPYAVAEVEVGAGMYAPCAGAWYRIDRDHLVDLQERIRRIPDLTDELSLRSWFAGAEDEEDYNLEALEGDIDHVVLDQSLFYNKGGRNLKVEICDLLTRRKELICVKKMTRSSPTLSHLFAQGSVSARLFRDNRQYQSAVMQHFGKLVPAPRMGDLGSWKVVFAIATDKPGRLVDSLFFFSKVNLDLAERAIRGAGLGIAVAKINLIKPGVVTASRRGKSEGGAKRGHGDDRSESMRLF